MQLSYICIALTKIVCLTLMKIFFLTILFVGIASALLLSLKGRRFRCHGGTTGSNHINRKTFNRNQ